MNHRNIANHNDKILYYYLNYNLFALICIIATQYIILLFVNSIMLTKINTSSWLYYNQITI